MPKGLGNLKDLRFLSDFVVGKNQETGIGELGRMPNLKGWIVISKLENIMNGNEAYGARMMEKKHITCLTLSWSGWGVDVEDTRSERDILTNLQPHWDLVKLTISFYRGTIFSDWLGSPSYHKMTSLELWSCPNCCMLPPLGQLPTLKKLQISTLEMLVSIGEELLNGNDFSSTIPFPSLEYLTFSHMTSWELWHPIEVEAFPKLQQLDLFDCPKLVGNLPCQLLSLETLIMKHCPLFSCTPRCPRLQNLYIRRSENVVWQEQELHHSLCKLETSGGRMLEELSKYSHLQHLNISYCSNTSLMIHLPPSLQHLMICRSENVDFVMSSNVPLQNLQSMAITSCAFIKFTSDDMEALLPNLRKLCIAYCYEMESFPEGILVPSLRELHIENCKKLSSHHAKWHLPSNITYLSIDDESDVKCFPEGYSLPTSLTTLELMGLYCLETLNCIGLQHLTSLQQLMIMYCPELEKLSGEKLPASLRKLHIWKCQLLEEKYHNKDEQLFRQISHIPHINLFGK